MHRGSWEINLILVVKFEYECWHYQNMSVLLIYCRKLSCLESDSTEEYSSLILHVGINLRNYCRNEGDINLPCVHDLKNWRKNAIMDSAPSAPYRFNETNFFARKWSKAWHFNISKATFFWKSGFTVEYLNSSRRFPNHTLSSSSWKNLKSWKYYILFYYNTIFNMSVA